MRNFFIPLTFAFLALVAVPAFASGNQISVSPDSGHWNYPGSFTVTNNGNEDVKVKWFLDCWDHDVCEDSEGEETLSPGASFSKGLGHICAKWQLDLKWKKGYGHYFDWGGIAEKENCEEPPVCEWDPELDPEDPNCEPPEECELDPTLPQCQPKPEQPKHERVSPAIYGAVGEIICVFPGVYAQPVGYRFNGSEEQAGITLLLVDEKGLVIKFDPAKYSTEIPYYIDFNDGSSTEIWNTGNSFYGWQPGDPDTGNIMLGAHNKWNELLQNEEQWSLDLYGWCAMKVVEKDKDDGCPDCPPAQCLLQPGNFVKVANQWVGLTTDSTPLVFVTEDEAEASGLTSAGSECGLCAEHLVRGDTVFVTEGSTAYDIAVALNISEGSPAPNYLNRHMEEALTALRNWQNAGKVDGWHSID